MYTLKQLIDKAYDELLVAGFSEKTVYGANCYIWNRLIRKHGENAIFEESMCREYCKEYFGKDIFSTDFNQLIKIEQRYIKAFQNLVQSSRDISFKQFDRHYHRDYILDEKSQRLLDDYIQKCIEDGNSTRTINNKKMRIRTFMIDIHFQSISKDSVILYLKNYMTKCNHITYTIDNRLIRRFLIFCYEKGELDKSILLSWPDKLPNIKNKKIPSVYSIEEISLLLKSAKTCQSEENHLRNFAILSLIAYTGMRASDVVNLRPSDIDWRNNEIRIIQQKTKKEIIYPLLSQIGNPIIEYIQNERSGGEHLFLTEHGHKLSPALVTGIINTYFKQSPIKINGRHHGAHALRHSIATIMVNNGISLFSVANTLGHSNVDCVKIYSKIDITHLRKCVLEAPYHA